jgi:hypothetical protein
MPAHIGQPAGHEKGSATALSPPRSAMFSLKPVGAPYQFRKIQVCPKDWPAALRQAERAANRLTVRRLLVVIPGREEGPCPT